MGRFIINCKEAEARGRQDSNPVYFGKKLLTIITKKSNIDGAVMI